MKFKAGDKVQLRPELNDDSALWTREPIKFGRVYKIKQAGVSKMFGPYMEFYHTCSISFPFEWFRRANDKT